MNFLKRCWQKRWLRRLTWAVVAFTALIASLYAWVNASGARQLRNVDAMLKAEGETLDFRETMNEPVPEAENFCAIPLLKDLALVVDNDASKGAPGEKRKRLEAMGLPSSGKNGARPPKNADTALGRRTDFKAWADFLRKEGSLPMPADSGDAARDVLAALAKHDAIIQELATGLSRPKAQWTPEWKKCELPENLFEFKFPHFSSIMAVNRTLSFRAAAAARVGEAAKAQEAALIMTRMTQAAMNDPFVIGLLVGTSGAVMLHSAIWEICAAHAGTAEDFTRLEAALTSLDFRNSALRAFRSEMTAGVNAAQMCKRKPENIRNIYSDNVLTGDQPNGGVFSHIPERAIPSGLLDASTAVLAEQEFKYIIKPLRDEGWISLFKAAQEWEKNMNEMKEQVWTHPCYIIASLTSPAFTRFINRVIFRHTQVNQAIIACALERYRIEKESYPDSLDAVRLADGKPLPLDPINEKPMGYRKTTDGRYALWSVGFDGKDDGGKRTLNEKKPENTQFHKADYVGDWVWDFPAE